MPRLVNKVPSYRLHKPSGQALVSLNGRCVYLGPHGTPESREAYRRLIAEWLANGKHTLPARPSTAPTPELTIAEVIARYWPHAEHYYRKNGVLSSEIHCLREAFKPLFELYGRTAANAFNPAAMKTIQDHDAKAGLARSTVNGITTRIKRLFKWAVAEGIVSPTVFHGLQAVSGLKRGRSDARETEPVKPVSQAFVDAIQPCVSRQVWALIQLQLLTGMRPGEAVMMRGCDLDTSGRIWRYTPSGHKTEHHGIARTIYLGPRAQEIIKPFLRQDVTAFLFNPAEAEAERRAELHARRQTPLSCGNRPGTNRKPTLDRQPLGRYTVASYRRAIRRACERALPPPDDSTPAERLRWRKEHRWHPHQLRHNAATNLRKEYGIEVARLVLGHRTILTTQVYAEMDSQKAIEVMSRIG